MTEKLYQLVYCSEEKGRVFRREFAVPGTGKEYRKHAGLVTGIEVFLEGYEMVVDREADPDEMVHLFLGPVSFSEPEFESCPFCKNEVVDHCFVRAACFCVSSEADGKMPCPRCECEHRITPPATRKELSELLRSELMSASGFTEGWLPAPGLLKDLSDQLKRNRRERLKAEVRNTPVIDPPKNISKKKRERMGRLMNKLKDRSGAGG